MTFRLRPAVETDQAAIAALVRAARINPRGLGWQNFQVAEANGQVIGVGQIRPHRDGSRELASIAVRSDWQGRGVGSAICQALTEGERGPMYLMGRDELEGFYARFGFRMVEPGSLPPYFRRIERLARFLRPVLPVRLIVMKRDGYEPGAAPTKLR